MRAFWSLASSFARVLVKSARVLASRALIRARYWQKCARDSAPEPENEQNGRYCSRKECEIYYISSGLGIWGAKIRIGTRSEYLVLDLDRS